MAHFASCAHSNIPVQQKPFQIMTELSIDNSSKKGRAFLKDGVLAELGHGQLIPCMTERLIWVFKSCDRKKKIVNYFATFLYSI